MAPLTGYDYFMENALKYGWAVPKGVIFLWSGSIATIPTGYVFCDGNNDTPDLRDRFVVGAKQDAAGIAKTNLTGALTKYGGAADHRHNIYGSTDYAYANVYSSGHVHYTSDYHYINEWNESSYNYCWDASVASDTGYADLQASGHCHGMRFDSDYQSAQPPYFALAYIMKT